MLDTPPTSHASDSSLPTPDSSFRGLKLKFFQTEADLALRSAASTNPFPPPTDQPAPLKSLLSKINSHPDHFATSSCSGRVCIYAAPDEDPIGIVPVVEGIGGLNFDDEDSEQSDDEFAGKGHARSSLQNGKSGGEWLFKSYAPVRVPSEEHQVMTLIFGSGTPIISWEDEPPASDAETLEASKHELGGIVSFKYEPMVLHITSSSPTASLPLLHAALSTGHQNSGLVLPVSALSSLLHPIPTPISSEQLSAQKRSNLAIRTSAMNLDCPIARKVRLSQPHPGKSVDPKTGHRRPPLTKIGYKLLVPPSYLSFLLRQANLRMESNLLRTRELEKAVHVVLEEGEGSDEWRRVRRVNLEVAIVEERRERERNGNVMGEMFLDEDRRKKAGDEDLEYGGSRSSVGIWLQGVNLG